MANHSEAASYMSMSFGDACSATLTDIARQCLHLGASGAALAIMEHGELITQASSGNAPETGTHTSIEDTLAGVPVRTGKLLCCDDTRCDPRLNTALCEELRVGSLLIVPLKTDSQVLGILALFAANPNSFSTLHIAMVEQLATRAVAALLSRPSTPPPKQESAVGESYESADLIAKSRTKSVTETGNIEVNETDIVSALAELRSKAKPVFNRTQKDQEE